MKMANFTRLFKAMHPPNILTISNKEKFANFLLFNPIALRKSKIVYNLGLSECNRVKGKILKFQ